MSLLNNRAITASVLTGGVHVGANMIIDGDKLDNQLFIKGGISAVSDYGAAMLVIMLADKLRDAVPDEAKPAVQPLVSGGVYTVAQMVLKKDNAAPMTQFLYQTGASFSGQMLEPAVHTLMVGGSK